MEYPITDELDLHTFRPEDLGSLIPEYLREAHRKGYRRVRVIHGKGTGTLRETVHKLLEREDVVKRFELGDSHSGGWGATIVFLR